MSRLLAQVARLFVVPDAPAARAQVAGEGRAGLTPLVAWQPPGGSESPPAPALVQTVEDGATRREPDRAVGLRQPAAAAVIGSGADAVVMGAALAAELRARGRYRSAVVLLWDPQRDGQHPLPAWPGPRRLAETLAGCDPVAPRGRIVQVQLSHDAEPAAAAAVSLVRTVDVPTVVVVAGPRTSVFDQLLATRDVLVVLESAGLASYIAELATAELRRLNPRVLVEVPIGGGGRRVLARAGVSRARGLGSRIEESLAC